MNTQVFETVTLDQLKNKPDKYLNPNLVSRPVIDKNNGTKGGISLALLIDKVKSQILSLDYREIDFRYADFSYIEEDLDLETYEVVLPDDIQEDVDLIIRDLQENEDNIDDEILQSWYFQINTEGEKHFNRTHFNNGLPYELRGTGFGYKIYKAFVTIKGFASSDYTAHDNAQRVWIKLVREADFECVMNDKMVLILNKKLHNKLLIAKQFIDFNGIHLNSSHTVISETLLNEIKPYISQVLGGASQEDYKETETPKINTDFKIGENVWVFDIHNNLITQNENLAHKLGARNWKKGSFNLDDYDVVTIENLTFSQGENVALVYSPKTQQEYLINVEGLEKEHQPDAVMNK